MAERRDIDFPFHLDGRGRVATASGTDKHIRDMIEQVLFTNPGERVNRPDFGCGAKALVFMPNSEALAAATEVLIKGALHKWLEREIQVEKVLVRAEDATLTITVAYVVRADGLRHVDVFAAAG
jgi:phage baseplate assembly protein W